MRSPTWRAESSSRRDYSLRARKVTDDELGVVVDAFNNMLDEVQSRTRALEQSNAALHESEKLYRAIGETIQYGVWVCDASGRNTYASDSFLRLTGYTQQQASDFGWLELLHPEDREATLAAWAECTRLGSVWYREHRMRGVDGQYHPILAQGVPIRNDDGEITRWVGINLDISRLKQTEQALLDADRRKDEFLATLAHELRNPLAPIRNAVRLLEIPATDEQQRRWGREVIARQVRNMALLLDDLLDVSRITRGKLELKKEYVSLRSVIEVAIETARPLIESRRHALTVTLPAEDITLEADPLRLSQVISNLLTNAAKYTDPDGRVALAAALTGTGLAISVKDSGIGLSAETIPGLFAMFSQVNTAIDRSQGGLGIGLGLVKGLVQSPRRHGRSAQRRSRPRQRVHRAVAEVRDEREEHTSRSRAGTGRSGEPASAGTNPGRRRQPRGGRIAGCSAAAFRVRCDHCLQRSAGAGARDSGAAERDPARHRHAWFERLRSRAPHSPRSLGTACAADRDHRLGAGGRQVAGQGSRLQRASHQAGRSARDRAHAGRVSYFGACSASGPRDSAAADLRALLPASLA